MTSDKCRTCGEERHPTIALRRQCRETWREINRDVEHGRSFNRESDQDRSKFRRTQEGGAAK